MADLKNSAVSLLNNRVFRLIAVGAACYFIGALSTESQVETIEVVKIDKEREFELLRQIEETKSKLENVKKNITTEETIILPDGTKKVIKTVDKSKVVSEELSEVTEKLKEKSKEIERLERELVTKPAQKNYGLGVATELEFTDNPLEVMTYEVVLSRRLVMDFWIFGQYNWTKQELGLGVELKF